MTEIAVTMLRTIKIEKKEREFFIEGKFKRAYFGVEP